MSHAALLGMILIAANAKAQPFAYVTNFSNSVSVINTATSEIVATVQVGFFPDAVAVTPDGTRAYVVNEYPCADPFDPPPSGCGGEPSNVSVIDTATNMVVATVNVGFFPFGVAISPDGTRAYVTDTTNGGGSISVINTATNLVVATITGFNGPRGIAITPDGTRAYVTDFGTSTTSVKVVDLATSTVISNIPLPLPEPGSSVSGIAITPNGSSAYATSFCLPFNNTECPNANSYLSVISTATNTDLQDIPVGSGAYGVAITPDGTSAYVVNGVADSVSVVSTALNTVTATILLGASFSEAFQFGVAFTPDGKQAYVVDFPDSLVQVINVATGTIATTIGGTDGPVAVAIGPMPFSSFTLTGKLETSGGVQFNGTLTLGAGRSINPPTETVTLGIGTSTISIPPNSFVLAGNGSWAFQGTINGVAVQIQIAPLKTSGQFSVKIEASPLTVAAGTPIVLTIGSNSGSAN